MATLAAQILTNYRVRIGAKTVVNNSRATSGSVLQDEDTAKTTALCDDAATWVMEATGTVDSSDAEAVMLGVQYAAWLGKFGYAMIQSPESTFAEKRLLEARDLLAQRRLQAVIPTVDLPDTEEDVLEAEEDE